MFAKKEVQTRHQSRSESEVSKYVNQLGLQLLYFELLF